MTSSAASSREFFESHGFCVVHDDNIGRTVKEVDDQGLATDAKSWEHFDDLVKRHAGPTEILRSFLARPNPQRCYTFGPEPGQIFCFWPEPEQHQRLVVAMWSPGSDIELYEGSHTGHLVTVPSSNGIFEASPKAVRNQPVPLRLDRGGMTILDLRMLCQRKAGFVIAYGMDNLPDQGGKEQ